MIRIIIRTFFSILLFCSMASCNDGNHHEGSSSASKKKVSKEALIEANRQAVNFENEQIDQMIRRYGWDMKETGTGLRYMIYQEGQGMVPEEGDKVFMNYTVSLITGDQVYSSDEDGVLKFEVGKAEISGLDEAVRLLQEGDKAKIVIPSYLAYGLIGDGKKINHKATLVYDVELFSVRKKEN